MLLVSGVIPTIRHLHITPSSIWYFKLHLFTLFFIYSPSTPLNNSCHLMVLYLFIFIRMPEFIYLLFTFPLSFFFNCTNYLLRFCFLWNKCLINPVISFRFSPRKFQTLYRWKSCSHSVLESYFPSLIFGTEKNRAYRESTGGGVGKERKREL